MPKESSGDTVTYQYRLDSDGGRYYSSQFEGIWDGSRGVHIIDADEVGNSFGFDQTDALESVLKFFADELRHGANSQVIGVVAIFKRELRRTFCSCNKSQGERHRVHHKDDGAVGEALKRRKAIRSNVLMLCDYVNEVTFSYWRQGRIEKMSVELSVPESMAGSQDMTMIMAAPLVVSSAHAERVVGALTFDYANYPSAYLNGYLEMQQIAKCGGGSQEFIVSDVLDRDVEGSEVAQETLRDIALMLKTFESATDIVAKMLGNYAVVAYDSFFREEWGHAE